MQTAALVILLALSSQPPAQTPGTASQAPDQQTEAQTTKPESNQTPTVPLPKVDTPVTDQPKAEPEKPANPEDSQASALWGSQSDRIIAFLTFVLAVIAGFQWLAARRANIHFQATERAYVTMSHAAPGFYGEVLQWLGPFHQSATFDVSVSIKVQNEGHTPAVVTGTSLRFFVTDKPLPASPPYVAANDGNSAFLVHDGSFHIFANGVFSGQELNDIRASPEWNVFLIGYVDYIDTFKKRHRAGYARVYSPEADRPLSYEHGRSIFGRKTFDSRNNLPFALERAYNYDRKRKRGEGNDWKTPT